MYAGFGQHRDSAPIDRANFRSAKEELGEASVQPIVLSFGHWAVGWTESLFVPATIHAAAKVAELQDKVSLYPVLDESILSEEEEEVGGLCGYCGESGHHSGPDGGTCGRAYCKSISTYKPQNEFDSDCFYCGYSPFEHEGYDDVGE
jgi:hypothetical protein